MALFAPNRRKRCSISRKLLGIVFIVAGISVVAESCHYVLIPAIGVMRRVTARFYKCTAPGSGGAVGVFGILPQLEISGATLVRFARHGKASCDRECVPASSLSHAQLLAHNEMVLKGTTHATSDNTAHVPFEEMSSRKMGTWSSTSVLPERLAEPCGSTMLRLTWLVPCG